MLPHQSAYLVVDYKPLPADRSFAFLATHSVAVNAVLDAKTPRAILVKNPTDGVITIPKHARMGTIRENTDSGYFASTWTTALKALTVAAALATPANADNSQQEGTVSAVGAEFELTPLLCAVSWKEPPLLHPLPPYPNVVASQARQAESTTPLTDQVYLMMQQSGTVPAMATPEADQGTSQLENLYLATVGSYC